MSITLNGFELTIPEATLNASSSQYGSLAEKTKFTIDLGNQTDQEADCDLYLDGVLMGHYRVGAKKKISCQRPTALARSFCFQSQGSLKSFDRDLPIDPESNGLVKAVFKTFLPVNYTTVPPLINPIKPEPVQERHPFARDCSAPVSTQCFVTVPPIEGCKKTTLVVRLIGPAPLVSVPVPMPVPMPVPVPCSYTPVIRAVEIPN